MVWFSNIANEHKESKHIKELHMAQNNKTESVRCPQDNFLFPRHLSWTLQGWRTSLSLVWCAKLNKKNKKNFQNTSDQKTKAGVPVEVTDKNMKQTNNTTVLALTRCLLDWAKKIKNGWQESLVFHLTNRFCFCSLWQKRKPKQIPRGDP